MDIKIMGPEPAKSTAASVEVVEPIMGLTEDEMAGLAQSILVMVPHRPSEGISAGITRSVGLWARHGMAYAPIDDEFAGHIDVTRASMAKTFLDYAKDRPELKYLVMIDSDEEIPWDAPYRLAAWDLPIVSGIVCSYSGQRGIWACFTVVDEYGVARFPSFNFTKKIPGKGLIEAHSVGGGLVCIRKDVLETLMDKGIKPFLISQEVREQAIDLGALKFGEDTWFCKQARDHGFKCYVDFSVRAKHIKKIDIHWPESHVDYNINPRDWKVDSRDYHHG